MAGSHSSKPSYRGAITMLNVRYGFDSANQSAQTVAAVCTITLAPRIRNAIPGELPPHVSVVPRANVNP
jgi:hypothetical protein